MTKGNAIILRDSSMSAFLYTKSSVHGLAALWQMKAFHHLSSVTGLLREKRGVLQDLEATTFVHAPKNGRSCVYGPWPSTSGSRWQEALSLLGHLPEGLEADVISYTSATRSESRRLCLKCLSGFLHSIRRFQFRVAFLLVA